MVILQHVEDGFFLVGRRLRQRKHGSSQNPHPSGRDPTEVSCVVLRTENIRCKTHNFTDRVFLNLFFRMVFCIKDPEAQKLTQEVTFVRCKDAWRTNSKRTPKR